MDNNAPHLPDDVMPINRARWFFLIVVIVSILGGVAGGTYAMRVFVPKILQDLINTLPLSNQTRETQEINAHSPFSDMVKVSHSIENAKGIAVGSAVSFTSDGWFITHKKNLTNSANVRVENLEKSFLIKNVITDSASDLVFFKVDARELFSTHVIDDYRFEVGETLYVASSKQGIFSASISLPYGSIIPKREVYDSETYYRVIVLDRSFPNNMLGSPVFNERGALVGILSFDENRNGQNIVIPSRNFTKTFRNAVKNGFVSHPYFGVRIKPQKAVGVSLLEFEQGEQISGSLRYGLTAVQYDSPAWNSGIRDNDIIMQIDEQEIGKARTLPEVLLDFESGKDIVVHVKRGEDKMVFVVALGSK